jgi:uncharacterized membrane protein
MKFSKIIKPSVLKASLFVVFFSLVISRTLFTNQLFRSDDLELHGARLANYYLSIKQGQVPPYWAPNLNHGFGYPVFIFGYHLPYMVSTFFYALGANIELSLNITIILLIAFGGLGVFTFSYLKNKNTFLAIVSSIVYQTTPYALTNIFVRGAIGEIAFLSFLPWVFVLIKTRDKANYLWHMILSILVFFGMVLSHPAFLMIFSPIVIGWLYLDGFFKDLFSPKKNKRAISFLLSAVIALFLTAWFWLPFLFERQFIDIAGHSITQNFSKRYLPIKQLFFSKWGYGGADFSKEVDYFPATNGLAVLLVLILSLKKIFINRKKLNKYKKLFFMLIVFFISIFLMLPISESFWHFSKVLPFLQYPWRFFGITTFSGIMILNHLKVNRFFLIILIAISLHHLVFYTKPLSYISNSNNDWLEYFGTSTSDNELKPIWFDEHENIGITEKVYLEKEANLEIVSWSGSNMIYRIEAKEDLRVLQKTMYFPGWEVLVNGEMTEIDYENEKYSGRVVFDIEAGNNLIESRFTNNTSSRKIGIYLTIIGMLGFIISIFSKLIPSKWNCKHLLQKVQ